MNIHKNARLTPQGRLLLVERITEVGWSVVQAAQAAGISVRQSYRWLARYRAEGPAGLADRSSAPHRCQHRIPIDRVVLGSCDLSMLHIGAQKRNPDHVAGKPRGGAGGTGAMPKCPAVPDR